MRFEPIWEPWHLDLAASPCSMLTTTRGPSRQANNRSLVLNGNSISACFGTSSRRFFGSQIRKRNKMEAQKSWIKIQLLGFNFSYLCTKNGAGFPINKMVLVFLFVFEGDSRESFQGWSWVVEATLTDCDWAPYFPGFPKVPSISGHSEDSSHISSWWFGEHFRKCPKKNESRLFW